MGAVGGGAAAGGFGFGGGLDLAFGAELGETAVGRVEDYGGAAAFYSAPGFGLPEGVVVVDVFFRLGVFAFEAFAVELGGFLFGEEFFVG